MKKTIQKKVKFPLKRELENSTVEQSMSKKEPEECICENEQHRTSCGFPCPIHGKEETMEEQIKHILDDRFPYIDQWDANRQKEVVQCIMTKILPLALSLHHEADCREFEKVKLLCPACNGEAEIRQFVDGELETSVCGRCNGKRYIILSEQRIALEKMKEGKV